MKASVERGKTIYESQCASCHMPQGEGIPGVFPPLAKSDFLKDKTRLVKSVLLGIRGPITVNGTEYNGEMPPAKLSDQEASDILNYIRNSWGNKAAPILPSEIKPALKAESKGFQPY
ncbi:MAG TPA: cytochrome c [Sphingobacteriaceae bacterium]